MCLCSSTEYVRTPGELTLAGPFAGTRLTTVCTSVKLYMLHTYITGDDVKKDYDITEDVFALHPEMLEHNYRFSRRVLLIDVANYYIFEDKWQAQPENIRDFFDDHSEEDLAPVFRSVYPDHRHEIISMTFDKYVALVQYQYDKHKSVYVNFRPFGGPITIYRLTDCNNKIMFARLLAQESYEIRQHIMLMIRSTMTPADSTSVPAITYKEYIALVEADDARLTNIIENVISERSQNA